MSLNWVRLDVGYFTNPKTMRVGKDGRLLHLASLCWVGQHETDGHVPDEVLPLLLSLAEVKPAVAKALVDQHLWLPAEGGFCVNGWDINPSKADTDARRRRDRERSREYRQRQREQRGENDEVT